MPDVNVHFEDGTKTTFEQGSNNTVGVKFEGMFLIVTDQYGAQFIYPATNIRLVQVDAPRRGF